MLAFGWIPGLARIPAGFSASSPSAQWRSQYDVCLSASSSHPVLPPPLTFSLFQFLKIKVNGDSVRLYFLVLVYFLTDIIEKAHPRNT